MIFGMNMGRYYAIDLITRERREFDDIVRCWECIVNAKSRKREAL